jgi:hypothetical protein
MIPACPKCRQIIGGDDINVGKDLAYCRPCNTAHALSELFDDSALGGPVDLKDPPPGVTCETGPRETVIAASHRSWAQALGLLGLCLFWNGIVSVFVMFALTGTLYQLGVALPAWVPKMNNDGQPIGVGELIFLWLFLTPFIAVGAAIAMGFVSTLAGKTEVRIGRDAGAVFVGIGRLGWTRRFAPAHIQKIELVRRANQNNGEQLEIHLEQENGKRIKFGSLLKEERQAFIVSALRQFIR